MSSTSHHPDQQPQQRRTHATATTLVDQTTRNDASYGPYQQGIGGAPAPVAPVVVQMPSEQENNMIQLIQETRLAQLATIEQQRELIKYVQDLHEWLERDVQERKSEREDLTERIERLDSDVLHRFRR